MTTTEDRECNVEWLAVSKGLAFSSDESVCVVLAPLNPDGTMREDHVWKRGKGLSRAFAGGVFRIMGNATFNVITPELKYVREWGDSEQVAAWRAAAHAVTVEAELRRKENGAKRRDHLAELLEPIRREWMKSSPIGRCAIEAAVLRALKRGR
jgi:hypothetical protein